MGRKLKSRGEMEISFSYFTAGLSIVIVLCRCVVFAVGSFAAFLQSLQALVAGKAHNNL